MFDILIAAVAGLVAVPLLFAAFLLTLSSGRPGLVWVYLATVLVCFGAGLWRALKSPGPTRWTLRVRNGMVSLCLALFAGAAVALAGYWMASRPPKQQDVSVILSEHRTDLELLKNMAVADGLETVLRFGEGFSRPGEPLIFKPAAESGLAPQRAAEYTRLMKAVGSERVDVWPDGTVHLSVAAWGAANRGWRMSLAWSAGEPGPLMPTIDGFPGTKPQGAPNHAFSRLGGDWYVYLTW